MSSQDLLAFERRRHIFETPLALYTQIPPYHLGAHVCNGGAVNMFALGSTMRLPCGNDDLRRCVRIHTNVSLVESSAPTQTSRASEKAQRKKAQRYAFLLLQGSIHSRPEGMQLCMDDNHITGFAS